MQPSDVTETIIGVDAAGNVTDDPAEMVQGEVIQTDEQGEKLFVWFDA